MSNPQLPAEILDDIVDHLHDTKDALKSCCLTSKSWVSRARKHLFAYVAFRTANNLRSWKTTFPNPSTSPARYTKSLFVKFPQVVAPADAEEGGWIPTFSGVVRLEMVIRDCPRAFESLPLFRGFSPVIRSIHIFSSDFSFSHSLNLIYSFPLLEDLSVIGRSVDNGDTSDTQPTFTQPSEPPVLTGCLHLHIETGIHLIISALLSLPSGPHFRQLKFTWGCDKDFSFTAALVEKCHHTLESLSINLSNYSPPPRPIGLSKTTELKEVTFKCDLDLNPKWIATTLQTITNSHRNFRQISLNVEGGHFPGAGYQEWSELDRSLFRLWESHSVRLEVPCNEFMPEDTARMRLGWFLPEVMKGGIVKLIAQEQRR